MYRAALILVPALLFGQTPAFDVASIKPNNEAGLSGGGCLPGGLKFTTGHVVGCRVTGRQIILEAFHLKGYQLTVGPAWLDSEKFDLDCKSAGPTSEMALRTMLQAFLAERFAFVAHHDNREMAVFLLKVGKGGAHLREVKAGDPIPPRTPGSNFLLTMTAREFADDLWSSWSKFVERPVIDQTGLPGRYLFELTWDFKSDLVPAVEEQLGLKFESQKAPVDVLVIDHVARPSAN